MKNFKSPEGECMMCHCYGITDFTNYGEFNICIRNNLIIISDEYGHEDKLTISYCPYCGRKFVLGS